MMLTESCCDKCSAALARYKVLVDANRGPLQLCAHHFNEHYSVFLEKGYTCWEISGDGEAGDT